LFVIFNPPPLKPQAFLQRASRLDKINRKNCSDRGAKQDLIGFRLFKHLQC
jgi:hypothetical protein